MLTSIMDAYSEDLEKTSRRIYPMYIFLLVICPFPLGGNRPWAWTVLSIAAFTLLVIYFIQYARSKVREPEISAEIKFVCFCLIFWLIYQVFLVTPLPAHLIQYISPATIDAVSFDKNSISNDTLLSLSLDKANSFYEVVKSSLYVSIFFLTILLVRSKDRLRYLLLAIVATGVLQAVFGLTMAFLDQEILRGVVDRDYYIPVKGTFINQNHFAGFMNLCISAAVGLIIAVGVREKRQIHRESHKHSWQSRLLDWRVYILFYCSIMIFALLFSQSRGAWFSFGIMVIFSLLILSLVKSRLKILLRRNKISLFIIISAIAIGGSEILTNRISELNTHISSRIDIWKNSLKIVYDFWLTGVGSGNFQYIYPLYDSGFASVINVNVIHAHNDYLELLIEQGIVGFGLLALIILISAKNAMVSLIREKSLRKNAFAISGLLGMIGLLVHAFVDFNFQIPSNTMYFFVFMAISLMQGARSLDAEKRDIAWEDSIFNEAYEPAIRPQKRIIGQTKQRHKSITSE